MKYNSPSLILVLLVLASVDLNAQPTAQIARKDAPRPTGQLSSADQANQLVASASRQMMRLPSVQAKVRQRVNLYGQELSGSGTYHQLRTQSDGLLLRLELKLTVSHQVASILQVCDGKYMWTRRELPNNKSLSTVNLTRVRNALEKSKKTLLVDPASNWMMLGGLSRLLDGLSNNFTFQSATASEIGGVAVWEVRGTWRKERLAKIAPKFQQAILNDDPAVLQQLPGHLPHEVVLVLGRDARILPLFPYRIDYIRQKSRGEGEAIQVERQSIATLELFEVSRPNQMDARMFRFDPIDQDISDQTDLYLESIGLSDQKSKQK